MALQQFVVPDIHTNNNTNQRSIKTLSQPQPNSELRKQARV